MFPATVVTFARASRPILTSTKLILHIIDLLLQANPADNIFILTLTCVIFIHISKIQVTSDTPDRIVVLWREQYGSLGSTAEFLLEFIS
jgi:hypothetical protein